MEWHRSIAYYSLNLRNWLLRVNLRNIENCLRNFQLQRHDTCLLNLLHLIWGEGQHSLTEKVFMKTCYDLRDSISTLHATQTMFRNRVYKILERGKNPNFDSLSAKNDRLWNDLSVGQNTYRFRSVEFCTLENNEAMRAPVKPSCA